MCFLKYAKTYKPVGSNFEVKNSLPRGFSMIFNFPKVSLHNNARGRFKCFPHPAKNGCVFSFTQWDTEPELFGTNSGVVLDANSLLDFLLTEGEVTVKDYETSLFGAVEKSSTLTFRPEGDSILIEGKNPRYKVEGKWVEGFHYIIAISKTQYRDMRYVLARDLMDYFSFMCVGNKDKKEVKRLNKNVDRLRGIYNESV